MTVGMREVKEKRKRWREHKSEKKRAELLGKHMIPVVLGPDERYYVVDHHHLARALHDEGVKDILVTVIGNLSMVDRDAFWGVMDNKRWVYPYDSKGERRHFKDIPKSVADLKDDPFRSLAGELRRAGGFAKDTTPFSEFLWADFLRRAAVAQDGGRQFRQGDREGPGAGAKPRRDLSARLVRAGVGRLALEISLGGFGDFTRLRCRGTGVGLRLAQHADRLRRNPAPRLVRLLLLERPLRRLEQRDAGLP